MSSPVCHSVRLGEKRKAVITAARDLGGGKVRLHHELCAHGAECCCLSVCPAEGRGIAVMIICQRCTTKGKALSLVQCSAGNIRLVKLG